MKFTIWLPPITKKNHQQIVKAKGRMLVIPSKQYREYEKKAEIFMPEEVFKTPINVKAVFYMATKRRCDLSNLIEALADIMVHYGVVEDDNCRIIVSWDGSRVDYDKNYPRTEVEITDSKEDMSKWN